ncbi:putative phosphohydrolase [Bernardetia litoralis DSM 6794]|uniref:Putative phosphohydrolase n=1 Tax=Bernardetia litoralis (strain ATCC 23117 / DSM 6794 / NBRC 15988 / NCIMB 1366 / Fx l1 / Sio-4) TaxID=880071 RepID=I4AI31_BERLS|nr:metallophosphoesterase [Bernardetia litoralis]AFM03616.1 putative phosphohydrolase [Bernardetia litoralis DSM 6794]
MKQQVFPKQFTKEIPKNVGRRFAISDIHGCGKTFIHLVEKILKLTKDDQLFIVGDLIDRGKNPILLIDYIIEKQKEDFQIFVLLGNHEQMLLETYQKNRNQISKKLLAYNYLEDLINKDREIKPKYVAFFNEMFFYIELENCFLVHAGFDINYEPLNGETLFTNAQAMLWVRKFKGNLYKTNQKPVVHGHVVHNLEQIKENLELAKENKTAIVPIDNGCVYVSLGKYQKYKGEIGNLCAVELTEKNNTWELFYTPFRDK